MSDPIDLETSVPHRSNLGPPLFSLYVNDLVDNISRDPFLFAYDINLLKELIQLDLNFHVLNEDLDMIRQEMELISC